MLTCTDGDNLCEPFILLGIIQDDEVSAAPAHICILPVFDDGGYTGIVFATIDCSANV